MNVGITLLVLLEQGIRMFCKLLNKSDVGGGFTSSILSFIFPASHDC